MNVIRLTLRIDGTADEAAAIESLREQIATIEAAKGSWSVMAHPPVSGIPPRVTFTVAWYGDLQSLTDMVRTIPTYLPKGVTQ